MGTPIAACEAKPETGTTATMSTSRPDVSSSTNRAGNLRSHLGPIGAYILLVILFYSPQLTGWRRFPDGDFSFHFVPLAYLLGEFLKGGHFPLWNPYVYSGHPFLADVQAAVYYPISTLWILVTLPWNTPEHRAYLLQVEAAFHFFLAACWTYLLGYAMSRDRLGAFLAGLTFTFSGYLTGYPPVQLAILRTAIWLPLALWGFLRGWRDDVQWGWLVTAVALALGLLAGHPQTFLFLGYMTVAWVIFLAWSWPHQRWRNLAYAAGTYLLAAGLSAAQWIPSLEFTRLSVRANLLYKEASSGFPVQDIWQLLLPDVLTFYSPLYVGVIGLELSLLAVILALLFPRAVFKKSDASFSRSDRRMVIFFALMALVFLLLSFGRHAFLYPFFYHFVPGWRLFRGQERASYIAVFALSILVGYGVVMLKRLPTTWRRRVASGYIAIILLAIALFAVGWVQSGRAAVDGRAFLGIAGRTVLWAILGGFAIWKWRQIPWSVPLLILVLVVDLFLTNMPRNATAAPPWAETLRPPPAQAAKAAVEQMRALGADPPGRVHNEYRVYENYGMIMGLEDVWGSSPLRLAYYARLFQQFPLDRMWRLLGVEHVLTWRKELFVQSSLLAAFPAEDGTTYLHRLHDRHPRAWLATKVQVVPEEELWSLLADHRLDLDTTALLSQEVRSSQEIRGKGAVSGRTATKGTVVLEQIAPGHVRVHVSSSAGGILIVSEVWMPGWKARLYGRNGIRQTVPVVRADGTLLGIPVPPGEWIVELNFRPASVYLGLAISIITLMIYTGSTWAWWR